MASALVCPTCAEELHAENEDGFRCREGHSYTVLGLALTNNIAALRAIWLAIRALEDDAASLEYMAAKYGDDLGSPAEARRAEAAAALEAAGLLRRHARLAQKRLDALPVAPSAVGDIGSHGPDGHAPWPGHGPPGV